MKRKIMACILAAALGITGVSFPTAAKTVSVGKNVKNITVNVKNPLDELRAQEAAMQQQEELEEEENMPEQDLDPLVLDNDGSVVPASQASWTKIESGAVEAVDVSEAPGDEEISENSTEDTFSDGSTDGDFDTNKNISDNAATEAGSEDIQTADGSISGELPADFSEGTENGDNGSEELQLQQENGNVENVAEPDNNKADEGAGQAQADFTDDANAAGDFSAGDASDGELGTYQTVTLEVEEGQDITAPLNTLFLELKDQATDENPCKIIIPPGNYELTGTLCMYSNMYLYARDANITKTSTTKHLILRLGNTKDSEGGYDGYRNIVIDGGTWGKSKSLGCGRANTESGKRARSLGYRNSVNRLQIQLCHLHDLIQHGKKSLGMCFLIINCIFRYQCIVLHNGYGCHDSGTVQCQNSHSVFSPLSSMVIFLYSKPFSRSFSMVTSILFSGRISSMSSAHSIRQIPCPKK